MINLGFLLDVLTGYQMKLLPQTLLKKYLNIQIVLHVVLIATASLDTLGVFSEVSSFMLLVSVGLHAVIACTAIVVRVNINHIFARMSHLEHSLFVAYNRGF